MSESPLGGAPQGQAPWMPPIPVQKSSRVPVIIASVVAILALTLAAAAWFKPTPEASPAAPQYSDQQVADAKKNLCDAYNGMYKAIERAGSTTSDDPNQKYMIALNVRIAFNTAADYILENLSRNPAAPIGLQDNLRKSANSFQRMILAQIADAGEGELNSIYSDEDAAHAAVQLACR